MDVQAHERHDGRPHRRQRNIPAWRHRPARTQRALRARACRRRTCAQAASSNGLGFTAGSRAVAAGAGAAFAAVDARLRLRARPRLRWPRRQHDSLVLQPQPDLVHHQGQRLPRTRRMCQEANLDRVCHRAGRHLNSVPASAPAAMWIRAWHRRTQTNPHPIDSARRRRAATAVGCAAGAAPDSGRNQPASAAAEAACSPPEAAGSLFRSSTLRNRGPDRVRGLTSGASPAERGSSLEAEPGAGTEGASLTCMAPHRPTAPNGFLTCVAVPPFVCV